MTRPVSIITGCILLILCGCYNQKEELLYSGGNDCSGVNSSYATTVQPIIQSSCTLSGCHDGPSTNGPGPLTSYDRVKDASARIRRVVISREMPKGGSLSAEQIKSIVCWIDSGTPNN
ncbi:MAG: hypothetical protein ACTHMC_23605 [Pseudobacter sp.]|uniref:hypothetical protein n=1 Tax=Pseudobacter sp. TaxID=2045420 RepID=UPI003F7FDD3E